MIDAGKHLVLGVNQKRKLARLIDLSRTGQTVKTFHGDVTNIQKLLSIQENLMGMLCFTKMAGRVNQQEIRIYDLVKNEFVAKRALDRSTQEADQESLGYVGNKIQLMQTQHQVGSMSMFGWDQNENSDSRVELDMPMEHIKYYPQLDRLAGTATTAYGMGEEESLLMLYDYSLRRLWQHSSPPNAMFSVVDQTQVAVQSALGYLEMYDTTQNTLLHKIDYQVFSLSLLNLDTKFGILVTANSALSK